MKLLSADRPRVEFVKTLLFSTCASLLLFVIDALRNKDWGFSYLVWNLFLAWLPLLFAGWLVACLKRKRWSSWEGIAASLLWLLFLPNSFYMVSDYIHLENVQRVDILYDAVMFTSFIFVAIVLGISSLYLVHQEFRKRFSENESNGWLGVIFLLCSFAIYLGRDLRWNSWDVLTNPAGLLFDISDRLLHLSEYPGMLLTVLIFFILIASMYICAHKTIQIIRKSA